MIYKSIFLLSITPLSQFPFFLHSSISCKLHIVTTSFYYVSICPFLAKPTQKIDFSAENKLRLICLHRAKPRGSHPIKKNFIGILSQLARHSSPPTVHGTSLTDFHHRDHHAGPSSHLLRRLGFGPTPPPCWDNVPMKGVFFIGWLPQDCVAIIQ